MRTLIRQPHKIKARAAEFAPLNFDLDTHGAVVAAHHVA